MLDDPVVTCQDVVNWKRVPASGAETVIDANDGCIRRCGESRDDLLVVLGCGLLDDGSRWKVEDYVGGLTADQWMVDAVTMSIHMLSLSK